MSAQLVISQKLAARRPQISLRSLVQRSYLAPLTLTVGLFLVHVFAGTSTTLGQRLLGATLGIPAIWLIWSYLQKKSLNRLPIPEYAFFQVYLYWGMATISGSIENSRFAVSSQGVSAALVACVLFTAAALSTVKIGLIFGAWLRRKFLKIYPKNLPIGVSVFIPLWLFLAVIMSAGFGRLLPGLIRNTFNVVFSPLAVLAFFAIGIKSRRYLYLAAAMLSLAAMMTGMLGEVFAPIVAAAALDYLSTRRFPLKQIVIVLLLYTILTPAKYIFREMYWKKGWDSTRWEETVDNIMVTPSEAIDGWWTGLTDAWLTSDDKEDNSKKSLDRFNELTSIARTLDYAGKVVPFDHGHNWGLMFYSLVPRFIDPNKPNFTHVYNDRFNIAFGMQTTSGTKTSTSSYPIVSQAYWGFGWRGVLFMGLLVGAIWGLLAQFWHAQHWTMAWIGMAIFADFRATSHIFGLVGALPQILAGVWFASVALFVVAKLFSLNVSGAYSKSMARARQ